MIDKAVITYRTLAVLIAGVLFAVLGYISTQQITKLEEIQKEIITVKLQITQIQAQMLNRNDVRLMIKDEVDKWHRDRREEREGYLK